MNRRIETALSGWLRALLFLCGASMLQAANPQDGGAPSPAPGVGEDLKELDANFELDRSWRQRIGMGTPLSFLGGAALGLGTYMVLKRVMPGLPGIVATGAGAAAVASWWRSVVSRRCRDVEIRGSRETGGRLFPHVHQVFGFSVIPLPSRILDPEAIPLIDAPGTRNPRREDSKRLVRMILVTNFDLLAFLRQGVGHPRALEEGDGPG